jgi:hypothetical protein
VIVPILFGIPIFEEKVIQLCLSRLNQDSCAVLHLALELYLYWLLNYQFNWRAVVLQVNYRIQVEDSKLRIVKKGIYLSLTFTFNACSIFALLHGNPDVREVVSERIPLEL